MHDEIILLTPAQQFNDLFFTVYEPAVKMSIGKIIFLFIVENHAEFYDIIIEIQWREIKKIKNQKN